MYVVAVGALVSGAGVVVASFWTPKYSPIELNQLNGEADVTAAPKSSSSVLKTDIAVTRTIRRDDLLVIGIALAPAVADS